MFFLVVYDVLNLLADVPEGSFIIRAHTPMSNLFSCLWFNEVERFTPRDQLSFAYTYHKFRRMNPEKSFLLNMFKVKYYLKTRLFHFFQFDAFLFSDVATKAFTSATLDAMPASTKRKKIKRLILHHFTHVIKADFGLPVD